jgi:hypothetical protein
VVEDAHGRPLPGFAHAAGFLVCRSPGPASHADEAPIWRSAAFRYPSHRLRRSRSCASSLKNLSWHAFEQNCRWYQRQRMRPHRVVPHWAHAFFIRLLRIHSFIRPLRMHVGGRARAVYRMGAWKCRLGRSSSHPTLFLDLRIGPATRRAPPFAPTATPFAAIASPESPVRPWNFCSGLLFSPRVGAKDFRTRCGG